MEDGFYWNYMMDFRGRLYVDSIISYQSARVFRNLYGYKVIIEPSAQDSIIEHINSHIERIKANTSFTTDFPNIDLVKHQKEIF